MICNENFGLGPKVVRGNHFWLPKFGPPGPNLAAKNGPTRPKMVQV